MPVRAGPSPLPPEGGKMPPLSGEEMAYPPSAPLKGETLSPVEGERMSPLSGPLSGEVQFAPNTNVR